VRRWLRQNRSAKHAGKIWDDSIRRGGGNDSGTTAGGGKKGWANGDRETELMVGLPAHAWFLPRAAQKNRRWVQIYVTAPLPRTLPDAGE
jgi:hypothetical protein